MNAIRRVLRNAAVWILFLALLTLTACIETTGTPSVAGEGLLLPMSTQISPPCETCAQATLAEALTQQKTSADNQAAATAEFARANAQATLNSANATLSAALTQDQNNANVIAAQIAGTAEIVRANAQATLNSAGSTQSAALTQDAIRQTQIADMATTSAESILSQQNKDDMAAGTQTAVANNIATQTQVAVATSQWYADQARQREEQRQGPVAFLWMWCLPIFVVLLTGFVIWGFWRWQKLQEARLRILENPVERLQAPASEARQHRHDDPLPYIESDIVDNGYQVTTPDDQVQNWVDEVKDQLLSSEKKDNDDSTDD